MPEVQPGRSRSNVLGVIALFTTICATGGIIALFGPSEVNPKHSAILVTALGTFFGWCLGISIATTRSNLESGRNARIFYTWGCAMCLLHIAVAYHVAHGWSQQAALEHVERASGFGEGLYVNYLFAAVWILDATWACVSFESYVCRPRWLNWSIHGFMAFIVFNAAVVFNHGIGRAICAPIFIWFVIRAWNRAGGEARVDEMREPGHEPGSDELARSGANHSPT